MLRDVSIISDMGIFSPRAETIVTVPVVPETALGKRYRELPPLLRPFLALGDVALSALNQEETVAAGRHALAFLSRVTEFIVGEEPVGFNVAEHSGLGTHRYSYRPPNIDAGLALARVHVPLFGPNDNSYVTGILAHYETNPGGEPIDTSAVTVSFAVDGHPAWRSQYARLSSSGPEPGNEHELRVAIGNITHHDIPVPDSHSSFDNLSALGDKLTRLHGQKA